MTATHLEAALVGALYLRTLHPDCDRLDEAVKWLREERGTELADPTWPLPEHFRSTEGGFHYTNVQLDRVRTLGPSHVIDRAFEAIDKARSWVRLRGSRDHAARVKTRAKSPLGAFACPRCEVREEFADDVEAVRVQAARFAAAHLECAT